MTRTVVLNVVGLTRALVQRGMPRVAHWLRDAAWADITPAFPAVTCTAQSDYLTGVPPAVHGIVGNGWYSREDCEVRFWKQANTLVTAPKLWDVARADDPAFTVANLFWWFNMYSSVDYSVTPRPMYPADGRKIPDVYTHPGSLRDDLQRELGTFPLFEFWGPRASIRSSRWIADAARIVEGRFSPTLTLVYVPHLDYNLQRLGVTSSRIHPDLAAVDDLVADLIAFYEARGVNVVLLSEYGLCEVSRPVHLNRFLREHGLLAVRDELGRDVLDPGASHAFAVADHQVAHVYLANPDRAPELRRLLEGLAGIDRILDRVDQRTHRIDHARSGDLVVVAAPDAWFTYYYWLDDARAPDYARTVDIHRKPGYDPVELFIDPALAVPALSVGFKLLKRTLGFRSLLDVIPLDATLVRGSHGRPDASGEHGPLVASRARDRFDGDRIHSTDVFGLLLRHLRDR